MEITGKIIQIMPAQEGISKSGNPWKVQPFVLETLDQYPRKVYIEILGEDRIKNCPLDIDHVVTVGYDLESREFNGRWYTSVKAWKVTLGDGSQQPAQQQAQAQATGTGNVVKPEATPVDPFDPNAGGDDGNSDLPF